MHLAAYLIPGQKALELGPADADRPWMTKHARRCLPLMIANQAGWWIRNPTTFWATWDGGDEREAITLRSRRPDEPPLAQSHFGRGVITWTLPWLFQTQPGWGLLLRGPANWPIDGAAPLEGLVETEWNPATATMNWQITRPGQPILFKAGMPFCQIMPMRAGELEGFQLVERDLAENEELHRQFQAWSVERGQFLRDLADPDSAAFARGWQRDYHQAARATKLRLARLADA